MVFTHKKPTKCTACQDGTEYIYFPSKAEYLRYAELRLLERSGHIDAESLELQPAYILHIGDKKFRAVFDFRYTKHSKQVVEDVKNSATNTPLSCIKRALAEAEHGIKVVLV